MSLLQACGTEECPESILEFLRMILEQYTGALPLAALGVFVFGAVAAVSYIRTDSVIIPVGLIFMTGGAVLPLVAPVGVQAALLMTLLAGAGTMTFLWYRYSR